MSLANELKRVADKLKNLSIDIGDIDSIDKEGFSHVIQRKPMFRNKQEAEQYMDDKNKNPVRARATILVKEMEETIKSIRWI